MQNYKKKKKVKNYTIREVIINSLQILNSGNWFYFANDVCYPFHVSKESEEDAFYFDELCFKIDIEQLIDKKDYYLSMSEDARILIKFLCFADDEVLLKCSCSTKKKNYISERKIAKFFRKRWGRQRVREAIKDIKKLITI